MIWFKVKGQKAKMNDKKKVKLAHINMRFTGQKPLAMPCDFVFMI